MIYPVFSIRDFKTGFLSPTVEPNSLSAARNFEFACARSDSLFFSHPEDYALYEIGTFDTDTGRMEPHGVVVEVMTATEAITAAMAHAYKKEAVADGE